MLSLMLILVLSWIAAPRFWLGLALGVMTPRAFRTSTGFFFHLPTPTPPLVHMLLLPLRPLCFSNGIIDLVIYVVLAYRL
jgi:hypothetical protein